ncbi:MAG: hypothetical protein V1664_01515 [Candidatus Uhrbacteria bacterium]
MSVSKSLKQLVLLWLSWGSTLFKEDGSIPEIAVLVIVEYLRDSYYPKIDQKPSFVLRRLINESLIRSVNGSICLVFKTRTALPVPQKLKNLAAHWKCGVRELTLRHLDHSVAILSKDAAWLADRMSRPKKPRKPRNTARSKDEGLVKSSAEVSWEDEPDRRASHDEE